MLRILEGGRPFRFRLVLAAVVSETDEVDIHSHMVCALALTYLYTGTLF